MISVSQLILFATAFGASAATPGLEVLAIFARAMDKDRKSVMELVLGIVVGKLLLLGAAMAGLAALMAAFHSAFVVLGFLGAGYLLYLAVKKWRAAGISLEPTGAAATHSLTKNIAIGFALTTSNPIAIAFYLAILPGVVNLQHVTISQFFVLAAIIIAIMSIVAAVYGLAGAKASQLFSGRGKLAIDRITALLFLACAILLVVRSWP